MTLMRRGMSTALALALAGVVLAGCPADDEPGDAQPAGTSAPQAARATAPLPTSPTTVVRPTLPPELAWQRRAAAPTAIQEVASAVLDGRVWVIGGLTAAGASTQVQIYDPARDQWSSGPDMPIGLHHHTVAVYRGELVVVGGFLGGGSNLYSRPSDRVLALRGGAWVDLPRLRRPRGAAAAAAVGDALVLVGGRDSNLLVGPTEVFDGTAWSERAPIPTRRDHLAAAVDGQWLYAVGGRSLSPGLTLDAAERYDPVRDVWEPLASLPTARGGLGLAALGGRLIAVGGEDAGEVYPQVEAYDPNRNAWSALAPMTTPRHGLAVNTVGATVLALVGGSRAGLAPSASAEALLAR